MKLNDMQITKTSVKNDGDNSVVTTFLVAPKEEKPKAVRSESMFIKMGLCFAAVLMALLVRTVGGTKSAPDAAEVATLGAAENEESLGALHFVDASPGNAAPGKWRAPVASGDIELMLDNRLVRFTAGHSDIRNCCPGEVLAVAEDPRLGKYVRLTHEGGLETIFYGFEQVAVRQAQTLQAGDILGNVPLGRSVYMSVLKNGAPQDPAAFVELNLGE